MFSFFVIRIALLSEKFVFASSYSCYLRLSFPGNVSDDLTVFIPILSQWDFESFTRFSLVRFQEVTCDRREERADKFADLSKTAVLGTVAFWLSGECCLPSKNHSLQGDFTPGQDGRRQSQNA